MVKARRAAIFTTDRLRNFEERYIQRRMEGAGPSDKLIKAFGGGLDFEEDDLFGWNHGLDIS